MLRLLCQLSVLLPIQSFLFSSLSTNPPSPVTFPSIIPSITSLHCKPGDSNLSDDVNASLFESLNRRISTLDSLATSLSTSFKTGSFKSTSYPLPTFVRRISMSYPFVFCGMFDGSVILLNVSNNKVCSVKGRAHANYRSGRDEDKQDQSVTCLHGAFDGGGVTAVHISTLMTRAYSGGRDGDVLVWDLREKEDIKIVQRLELTQGGVVSVIREGRGEGGGEILVVMGTDEIGTVKVYERGGGNSNKKKNNDNDVHGNKDGGPMFEEGNSLKMGGRVLCGEWSTNKDGSLDYGRIWIGLDDGRLCQVDVSTMAVGFEVKVSDVGIRAINVRNDEDDNDVVYVGDAAGKMYVVDVGGVRAITPPHRDAVVGIAMAGRDKDVMITGSRDGSVRVWGAKINGGGSKYVMDNGKEWEGKYVIGPMKVWLSGIEVEGNVMVTDGADNAVVKHEFGESGERT